MKNPKFVFYLLSFLEGASVMAAELLGAKMLSPFFGSSIYVWSSVLAVTLGGLASGYFAGGIVSGKRNVERNLYYTLLASAIFMVIMPALAKEGMMHTGGLPFQASVLISSCIILFPPVFFMGMVSPLVVQCISALPGKTEAPGKAAGTVYAVSTMGGILSTFLLGFYFIPEYGLTGPCIVIGIILGAIPFILLITGKKFSSILFLIVAVNAAYGMFTIPVPAGSGVKLLYSSEGLLGQIIVADYRFAEGIDSVSQRILFVNRSTQTVVTERNGEKKYFEYVDLIARSAAAFPSGKKASPQALVLGLGGGSVANALLEAGFAVDAAELDSRMAEVARTFFELDKRVNVTIDDARHFVSSGLKRSSKKYDMIVLDAFIGEVNPHHLFTHEFFSEMNALLADSGKFFINGNGFWEGEAGAGMRSVCKTLLASGFDVTAVPTGEAEEYRNLLLAAERSPQPHLSSDLLAIVPSSLDDAVVLEDEKPCLDLLNAEANKRWREACMKYFLSGYYSGRDRVLFR